MRKPNHSDIIYKNDITNNIPIFAVEGDLAWQGISNHTKKMTVTWDEWEAIQTLQAANNLRYQTRQEDNSILRVHLDLIISKQHQKLERIFTSKWDSRTTWTREDTIRAALDARPLKV
ncbi:MAG: hypothetical protein AB7Q04_13455 [Steroidobacteraceae bacterium]